MNPPNVTSPRWSRPRSCVRSVPRAPRGAWLPPRRAFLSRTSPSTPRWPLPPFITGRTRLPACARCGAWLAAWWCSRATPVTGPGVAGSGLLVTTSPRSLLPASASLPSWPARWEPGLSRCSFRGTALTDFSRPTGAGPRRTWTRTSVVEYRCGPASGRTPSRGQCAASVTTSHPVDGSNATATSSISKRQSLAFACLSPEPATAWYHFAGPVFGNDPELLHVMQTWAVASERDVEAFDDRAEVYERGWRGRLHHQVADEVAALVVRLAPNPRCVLDVGCGTGY